MGDQMLIRLCSLTLAGIKTGNLFTVEHVLIYLYGPAFLKRDVANEEVYRGELRVAG